jgi:hypothetical protein
MKPETMKARAEKAPQPSPWTVQKQGDRYAVLDANGFWVCDVGRDRADAIHIATSHPQAVIDLVDALADALAANAKWQDYFTGTPGLAAANAEIIALRAQIESARNATKAYTTLVDYLGAFADDSDPRVMALAGPIGEVDGLLADADIYRAAKVMTCGYEDARSTFGALWAEINGIASWPSNPWVWVIEFRRVEAQERAA